MAHSEGQLTSTDGLMLRTQRWTPEGIAKAVIVLSHGLGEHSGRYGHTAAALTAAGYSVYTYDLRGHGKSGGPRGHAPNLELLLDDVQVVYDWARVENAGRKFFLMAHSMGGNITVNYVLHRQPSVAGVVLSSPWLGPTTPPAPLLMNMGRFLSGVLPAFALDSGITGEPLAHDADLLSSFPDLSLTHTKITARMGTTVFDAADYALAHAAEFKLPLFILQAGADRLASAAASKAFCERAGSGDKQYRLLEGMFHEILNETERGKVMQEIVTWLDAHTS
jgi:alpha-beta hydrolase superfamily lysophospholipase